MSPWWIAAGAVLYFGLPGYVTGLWESEDPENRLPPWEYTLVTFLWPGLLVQFAAMKLGRCYGSWVHGRKTKAKA